MPAPSVVLDPRRRRAVLGVMALSLMMVVSAVSGLNVALPDMARETGATQSQVQWIVDAYTVTLAGLLFFAGAVGDRFGRKGILLTGLTIFGVAAAGALLTTDPTALIVLRAIMGVGAAAVMPTTLSVINTSFPIEERGKAVGVWVGVAGGGAVLGLLLTGILLEFFAWNSFFTLNLTLAVIAGAGAVIFVPNSVHEHPPALDPVGALLALLAVGGLVFGIIEGPVAGWNAPATLVGLIGGACSLALFLVWEARQREPLLDPRLFALRGFSAGSLSNTAQFFCSFGFFFVALQYLQYVVGYSPLEAALAILPLAVVLIPLARQAPKLAARAGFNRIGAAGLIVMAAGFLVLSTINVDLNYAVFLVGLILFGAGMALAGTPATTAITSSLPDAKQGVASAMNDTSREFGSALGIAILGSVLNSTYRDGMASITASTPPNVADAAQDSIAAVPATAARLGDPTGQQLIDTANNAFVNGATDALLTSAAVLVCAAVIVFLRAPRAQQQPAPSPATAR
jgi:EmrB/QacA subfamily drug resistance transporter